MSVPHRILVVVDPTSDTQPALQRASWIARKTGAHLELFIASGAPELHDRSAVDKARTIHIENQLRRLLALARPLAAEGLDVSVDAACDAPLHEAILRKSHASRADLVVKDTHYHSALKRAIFSNTDWNLIRTCPTPLWLAKARAMSSSPRFIAAVDPMHERAKPAALDEAILRVGTELSTALGGELEVFHAFDVAPVLAASSTALSMPLAMPLPDIIDAAKTLHTDAVHALTDGHGIDRDRVHVEQGATRVRLLALTENLRADVVVMGAVSRGGIARVVLGNTAEDVLDRLGCDLVVVKPPAIAVALRTAVAAA